MVTERISRAMQKVQLKNAVDNMAKTLQGAAGCAFGDFMSKSMGAGTENKLQDVSAKPAEKSVQDTLGGQEIGKQTSKTESIAKEGAPADTEELKNTADTVLQEIKDVIKDELNLTDEELEALLAQNGMTLIELLIPKNLATFVAEAVTDGDTMKLLTDGKASEIFSGLTAKLDRIVTENAKQLGLSKEEFTGILAKNQDVSENFSEEATVKEPSKATDTRQVPDKTARQETDTVKADERQDILAENKARTYADTRERAVSEKADPNIANKAVPLEEKVTFQSEKKSDPDASGKNGENLSGHFVETLIEHVDKQLTAENVFEGYSVNTEDVIRQIVDAVKVSVSEHMTSMELQLSPESLGKVSLVVASKEGVITAQITAQNEAVKTVIENQLVSLKESFNAQGLKVEAVEVTIASHGFEMGRNFEGSEGGKKMRDERHGHTRSLTLEEIDARIAEGGDFSEEEQLAAEMMRATGRSVDYMA